MKPGRPQRMNWGVIAHFFDLLVPLCARPCGGGGACCTVCLICSMTGRFCSTAAAGSTDIYPPDDFSSFSIGLSANQRKRNLTLSQLRTRSATASYLPKCQCVRARIKKARGGV